MGTKTLQIRELDEEVLDVLKARTAMARMSLSAYVAEALTEMAASPTGAGVIARAREIARGGGGATDEDILNVIREGRDR